MKPRYFVWAYLAMAVLFAIFGGIEGRAFSYNLGRGLGWPMLMFPSMGKYVTGVLILGLVLFLTLKGK